MSCVIRKYETDGGIILSASHNPGGPDADFGLKFNGANGGPAPESVGEAIYRQTLSIDKYLILDTEDIELGQIGKTELGGMEIEIIDPVTDYAELMASIFDFDKISQLLANRRFHMCFDAMHAVTGPYARTILEDRLGAKPGTVINGVPDESFGGGHPDPQSRPCAGTRRSNERRCAAGIRRGFRRRRRPQHGARQRLLHQSL